MATEQDAAFRQRHFLWIALCVAAVANILVPALFFSDTQFFAQVNPQDRILVTVIVAAEYVIALLLILLHANVGLASGYAVATAVITTLGSIILTYLIVNLSGWDWYSLYAGIFGLAGFAFAVVSNGVFLFASIRYARAIHPRLHLGGFCLGVVASVALIFLYVRILQ